MKTVIISTFFLLCYVSSLSQKILDSAKVNYIPIDFMSHHPMQKISVDSTPLTSALVIRNRDSLETLSRYLCSNDSAKDYFIEDIRVHIVLFQKSFKTHMYINSNKYIQINGVPYSAIDLLKWLGLTRSKSEPGL